MGGYIKYFENRGKNMPFLIRDNEVWEKYEKNWDKIKVGIKFYNEPIYEKKYLKGKVREFDDVIKTFWEMMCQKKICIILSLLA